MPLWGGRFGQPPSEVLWRYTVDHADRRLLIDDVTGSIAHVSMLGEAGILPGEDVSTLTDGLRRILAEAEADEFEFGDGDEDVHSAVERRLVELIGEVGGKLHTGRSRNDQVALDVRLYLRRAASARAEQIGDLAMGLADLAEQNADVVVPVFTHLQQAQPISFGHHLMAHAWSLLRDRDRILGCMTRLDVSPLGAGAAGGSSLPLRPDTVMSALGMSATFDNSIDAVAGRDVVTEYAFCCAQAMAGLSRLSEELVLWGTSEFGWATYDDATVTGSSALPQKQNPDIAELARGGPPRSLATSLLSSHCKRGCRSPTSVTCRRTRHSCSMRTTRWRRRSRRSAPCSPAPDSIHLYLRQRPRRSTLPSGSPGEASPFGRPTRQ